MINGYLTISGEVENTIVIERSKFITSIKGVKDEDEAKQFIEKIRKMHSLATHNCYAYIADDKGLIQKFSDDGEPQGTAGMPMLDVLKNKRIYKTVAVVTRYFGGIKLGTGGLTRAYGGSVVQCLEKARIVDMQPSDLYLVNVDYDGYSKLLKNITSDNVNVISTKFDSFVSIELAVKKDFSVMFTDKLLDVFNGKIDFKKIGEDYFAF